VLLSPLDTCSASLNSDLDLPDNLRRLTQQHVNWLISETASLFTDSESVTAFNCMTKAARAKQSNNARNQP